MLQHLLFFKKLKKSFHFIDSIIIIIGCNLNKTKIKLPILQRDIFFRNDTKDLETFKEIFNENIYNLNLPISPKTIIDAGANVGYSSIFFRLKYPESSIVAIEIEKSNVKMIKKNTLGFTNFYTENKGLYNKKSFFKIEDPYNATNSFVIKEVEHNAQYDIESVTVDEIRQKYNWETIDILKIDIEGAEKQLFESNFEEWLPLTKIIMVETHDRMVPKCSYTVMETINKYNFILFTTTEGTLIYYNLSLVTLAI